MSVAHSARAGSVSFGNGSQIQLFDLFARPGGTPQELQAGFEARLIVKTADRDAPGQFGPAVLFDELCEDHFERNAVQGIIGLERGHLRNLFISTPTTALCSGVEDCPGMRDDLDVILLIISRISRLVRFGNI